MDRNVKHRLTFSLFLVLLGASIAWHLDDGRHARALGDLGMLMYLVVLTAMGSMPEKGQWKASLGALPFTLRGVFWGGVVLWALALPWQIWTEFRYEHSIPGPIIAAVVAVVFLIAYRVGKKHD